MRGAERFARAMRTDPRFADPRVFPCTGVVRATEEHPSWGLVVNVEVPGYDVVACRPAYLGNRSGSDGSRTVHDWVAGSEVLVVPIMGSMNSAIALPLAPSSRRQSPAKAPASGIVQHEAQSHHDFRLASGADAQTYAVVAKPFLDDLDDFLAEVVDAGIASGTAVATPPVTLPQVATAVTTIGNAIRDLGLSAASLRTQVQLSIATTEGKAPHCAKPLRASVP